jgi:NADH-quinone oxidoreductase subunit M
MLWLYQRTMFGKVENPKNEKLLDLNLREFATFAPLLILAVWIGLYPSPFLRRIETSVNRVVARVNPDYRLPATAQAQPRAEAAEPGSGGAPQVARLSSIELPADPAPAPSGTLSGTPNAAAALGTPGGGRD